MIERLHDEEAAIARLYAQRQLTEQNYGRLHREWQTKLFEVEQSVHKLQSSTDTYIDNLDAALMLLAKAQMLYEKLPIEKQARLLQILCRRIIIDGHGRIIDFELNPPFMCLHRLKSGPANSGFHERQGCGLEQLLYPPA